MKQIGDWIKKNKFYLIIGLIIIVALIKLNILPSSFTAQTFSILGGSTIVITFGVILLAIGIICLFLAPETGGLSAIIGILFILGAWLIAGGGLLLAVTNLFQNATGWIILAVFVVILWIIKK